MNTKIISFRCPTDLLGKLDFTAEHFKRTRNSVLLAAVRLFARQVREQQGGAIVPPLPAEMLTHEAMFPKPENKGGRPPKYKHFSQD